MTQVLTLIKAFGRFWWDFLVGDTPELFVSTLVILAATALLSRGHHSGYAAEVILPLLVVLSLLWSVRKSWPKR